MSVRISSLLLARLRAEADASPDREVCGLLFGSEGGIDEALPTPNVSAHLADSFEIDPAALFAALRAERAGGPRVIGHYHSHPTGAARPSPRDAAAVGEVGRLWLILGGGEVTLWRAIPGGPVEGAFEAVCLETEGEAVALADVSRHKGAEE
jgi:proteasome lid subunit RPN8/RPN11